MKSPDEFSRELSKIAKLHPHVFFSFLLIDASVMIRELAGLPALAADPMPAPDAENPAPKAPGRPKLAKRHDDAAEALKPPRARPALKKKGAGHGFFFG